MDAEGVAAQLVSPIPVTLCHGEPADGAAVLVAAQNEFLAALVERGRGRLYGLGAVPLQDPVRANIGSSDEPYCAPYSRRREDRVRGQRRGVSVA